MFRALAMKLFFSFIIPVYNRPNELKELLDSLLLQTYKEPFEVIVVEDGSTISSENVVSDYSKQLRITYLSKPNSGPGDSRNYGMKRAKGNYFIILDSDCILPPQYVMAASEALEKLYVDCYGGPDAAHESFTTLQKAINYAMTSFLTTGGIRGGNLAVDKFQPRSFNMGISKSAFEATGGYGTIHPGEDPDLTIRIWKAGFETKLIPEAFVYHKRRINWHKFYAQVHKFGMVRPILNQWHPETQKITYWFPTLFCIGFLLGLVLFAFGITFIGYMYLIYFLLVVVDALLKNKNLAIAVLSLAAVCIQFVGYGYGFLKSTILLISSEKKAQDIFPKLFFTK